MPKPRKGEKKNNYISRCIRKVRHEGTGQKQAVGKCYGMWKYYSKESRILDFQEFVNECENKEKLEINKEIKKKNREDQLKSGADLRTRIVPSKKVYRRNKKIAED